MLVDIANATVADGHRVSVCITRSDFTLARELHPDIEVLVLDRKRRFSLTSSITLAGFVRSRKPDVLHVHLRHTLSYVLLLRILGALRTPIVFHDHYGTIEIDRSVPMWFRVAPWYVDEYVGVYERLCEWAIDAKVPASRTTTIANALDLRRLRPVARVDLRAELGLGPEVLLGVLVATIRRDKGIEMLLQALATMQRRDGLHVAIAGVIGTDTYSVECRQLVSTLGLASTVTFLGGRTDVPQLLPGADFALLSSHTESGPLVLVEYLAAGLPIVATRVGDIGRQLAAAGVPGFVPARDSVAFARELDELVRMDANTRRERGRAGTELLETTWELARVMPRWYEVYRRAVSRVHPGA